MKSLSKSNESWYHHRHKKDVAPQREQEKETSLNQLRKKYPAGVYFRLDLSALANASVLVFTNTTKVYLVDLRLDDLSDLSKIQLLPFTVFVVSTCRHQSTPVSFPSLPLHPTFFYSLPAPCQYLFNRVCAEPFTLVHDFRMSYRPLQPNLQEIRNLYANLTHHYVPGPQSASFFLAPFLLFVVLLIPPTALSHKLMRTLFLPMVWACIVHAWYEIGGVEVMSFTVGLWAVRLMGVNDGRGFRRVRWRERSERHGEGSEREENGALASIDDDARESMRSNDKRKLERRQDVTEETYPEGFIERVQWVSGLLVSLRLSGWKTGEERHDRAQPAKRMSRIAFAKHALLYIVSDFLILDATFFYVKYDPYFTASGMGVDAPFPALGSNIPAVLSYLWMLPPRIVRCSVLAAQVLAMVSGMFYLPTLPAALLNGIGILPDEWSPHTWPPFFGNFEAMAERGLRGLWGEWWHQVNREFVSSPGKALVKWMELPKRSLLSYALLVATSFLFSGVLHMGLIPPEPLTKSMTANEMRICVAMFFWIQAPGIVFESLVESLYQNRLRKLGSRLDVRILVLGWVAAWLCLTLPFLTVPFREIGYWNHSPVGRGLLRPAMDINWR